ncbi:hypothetical protein M9Y10_032188 [Tritrichomonas musculus]|uniref:Uncharacterized protein n=1 Tax=Tritrichomonas musculus TaxID=1915356 RepID=A0ABR2GZ84_9EUKA
MKPNLSIYFIIGYLPNEFFDSTRIDCHSPLSDLILLHSISKYFFELPSDNFHVFGIGQKEDYLLLQHVDNKVYCQLGNFKEDIFNISCKHPIKFTLFPNISNLFINLGSQISKDSSENIMIIFQDQSSTSQINTYPYLLFLYQISNLTNNFFIYNDSCHSGTLVDLLSKNNFLFNYIKDHPIEVSEDFILMLYLYAALQSTLFDYFNDFALLFLKKLVIFLSKTEPQYLRLLFKYSCTTAIDQILKACNNNIFFLTRKKTREYFSTEINESFFDILKKEGFDFNDWIKNNHFEDFASISEFLNILKILNIKYLGDLMMIKAFIEFTDTYQFCSAAYFKDLKIFELFKTVEEIVFSLPEADTNASVKTIKKHKVIYDQITHFFYEYHINYLSFFEFKPKIEIVTSTSTKVFPNSTPFAFFIRSAFFNLEEHIFEFTNFVKHASFDQFFVYEKFKKPLMNFSPQHYIYPELNCAFKFSPSTSLPKKIAAVRFLTHSVRIRLLEFSNLERFPNLSFSCGFSSIPSRILINFISLSILPYSDDSLLDLKLYNENFLDILKFSSLILKTHSTEFSINDSFEFIAFFSVILSSKIRYLLAQQLLLSVKDSSVTNSISLFSINELKYTKEFISNKINNNGSDESTKIFLHKLFSENLIDQYYNIKVIESHKKEILNTLHDIKQKPEFNIQKMFLDLESSILNILPNDVFVFSAIYSYLLLKQHANLDFNLLMEALSSLLEKNIYQAVKEKLESFNNSFTDIMLFCNQYILKRLNDTFVFLQSFYRSYYFVSFCKVSNRYDQMNNCFKDFLTNFMDDQKYVEEINNKLKPFPLFCLPFIFFNEKPYLNYNENIKNPLILNSSELLESNNFYSQQFRICLSDLSQCNELKKSVLDDVNVLNKFIDDKSFDLKKFLSFPFFQNPSSSPESFHIEFQSKKSGNELKYPFEFCVKNNFEKYLKDSISTFVKQFISNMNKFVLFNPEVITDFNCNISNDLDDSKFFFSNCDGINVYIDYVHNILIDLLDILNITKKPLTYDISLKEEAKNDVSQLAFSVLGARFNNKVEIDSIISLIPKYENKFSNDLSDPTIEEYMALCSAIRFTNMNPIDKLTKRICIISSQLKDSCWQPSSPSISPIQTGDFCNNYNDTNNSLPIVKSTDFQKSIDDAFQLSFNDIDMMYDKYDLKHKRWTDVIWSCFFDFFNKKLGETENLHFDVKDEYSQGSSCFNCFAKENKIIMEYLPQLEDIPDIHQKKCWIGRFLSLHKEHKCQIKSAYVYAFISSYVFLRTYYSFGGF